MQPEFTSQSAPETSRHVASPTSYESNPFKLFGPSWQAIKVNIKTWILAYLRVYAAIIALIILLIAAEVVYGVAPQLVLAALAAGIAATILYMIWFLLRYFALSVYLQLAGVRGTQVAVGQALRASSRYSLRVILFSIIYGFLVVAGLLVLIVPGIIFAVWYMLTPYVIVDEDLRLFAAMRRSKQLVQGRFFDVFGVGSIAQVVSLIQYIPFIGLIVSIVLGIMYAAAPALRYSQIKSVKDQNGTFPPTSMANYVLPILIASIVAVSALVVIYVALNPNTR